jgi:hypothetical protein
MKPAFLVALIFTACTSQGAEPSPGQPIPTKTLKALPHVHAVTVSPATKEPKRQIIHILNWHFVPRADFALDIRTEAEKAGVTLSDDDVDRNWESFLGEVEAVQDEQMAVLRELAKSYGLKQVFIEGLA